MIEKFGEVLKKTCENLERRGPNIESRKMNPRFESKLNYDPIYRDGGQHLPKNDGKWSGSRGNSTWIPDRDKIPSGRATNYEGQSWGKILDNHKIDGISFKDGEPDFRPIAKETVRIDNFTERRSKNFLQADEKAAKKLNCSPEDIRKLRQEHGYTWHERRDCRTMDLVPSEVHNNIPHSGGISEKKLNRSA
ncbi:HNH endonuclease [Cetobacterium sp. SF1]|uniref:HNH endonuclease n=1 Tax=Cetobacterium sp. SF1 TaxID=3417654 RepID=UPI003CF4DA1F